MTPVSMVEETSDAGTYASFLRSKATIEGDTVFDPFAGIMTVPYCAVKLKRVGVGVELNPVYFSDGVSHLEAIAAGASMPTLFDAVEVAA